MALKWEDVDLNERTITIRRSIRRAIISTTKTGDVRTVPIVDELYQALKKWQKAADPIWLFANPMTGSPYTASRTIVDHYFKPMLKNLGISFKKLYSTRHTFASLSVQNEIPMHIVKECMGHKDIATTQRHYMRFGNVSNNDRKKELERLIA